MPDARSSTLLLLCAALLAPAAHAGELPRCARVAPGNPITLDQDRRLDFVFAGEAVLIAYAGGLSTLETGDRVHVRYNNSGKNSSSIYSFKITDIVLNGPGGRPSISVAQPRQASFNASRSSPCAGR